MLENPQIIQTDTQLTAVIRLLVPSVEIRQVMGPGLQELYRELAVQGVKPTGPWLTRHFRRPAENFDFEIALPVAAPVKPAGRVTNSTLPGATLARAVYQGPYEGLGAGWGEFEAWLTANGHTPEPGLLDFWECYLVGPESTKDSAAFRTELNRPLTLHVR